MYYNKESILNLYKKKPFPKDSILPECLSNYDILFSKDPIGPQESVIGDHHSNFFIESEKTRHKESIDSANNWRSEKRSERFEFKSFQKRKLNKLNTMETKAISLSNNNEKSSEHYSFDQRKSSINEDLTQESQKTINKDEISPTFFQESFQSARRFIFPQQDCLSNVNQTDSISDIKVIYNVNKKLHILENDLLWYLFNSVFQYSYGPFSSLQIENMYCSKQVFANSLIRLIDIFEMKNSESFSFFHLKDLENQCFLNDIVPSKILKILSFRNSVVKEIVLNYENKQDKKLDAKSNGIKKQITITDENNKNNENKKDMSTIPKVQIEEDMNFPKIFQKVNKKKKKLRNFEQNLNKMSIYDRSLYTDFNANNTNNYETPNIHWTEVTIKKNPYSFNKSIENVSRVKKYSDHHQEISYDKNYEVQNDFSDLSKYYDKKLQAKGYGYRVKYSKI